MPAEANEHNVVELTLFIENEYDLIGAANSQGKAISKNLARKYVKGDYDHTQAVKAWKHLADSGARSYGFAHGHPVRGANKHNYPVDAMFSAADRNAVAKGLADAWLSEVKVGGIDVKEEAGFAPGSKYLK